MENIRERRRYIRTEIPIAVNIRFKHDNDIKEIRAQSKNISATGMLLELTKKIVPNTAVELSLMPPETQNPIHINAKVIRSIKTEGRDSFSTGIEFTKIEEDNKNTFLKFLCDTIYKLS